MRQYKTELSIIFILIFFWEAEFFILDIWLNLKSDTQTVFAQDDTSPGSGQTTPSTNSEPLKVVINEIAWMGTKIEGVDSKNWWQYEWIELFNNSDEKINLSDWEIGNAKSGNKAFKIRTDEIPPEIFPKDYFLICRKKMEGCDLMGSLSLNDDYEKNGKLFLLNKDIIDQTPEPTDSEWPAGKKETKQTMERKSPLLPGDDSLNWQISQNPGGTPKAKNSKEEEFNPPPEKPSTPPENPENTPDPIVPNVIINELFPNPKGKEDKEEFIELKNLSDSMVYLVGWQIKDKSGKTYNFIIEKIPPQGLLALFYEQTKIHLNNTGGEKISLYDNYGNPIDSISYQQDAIEEYSYNFTEQGWLWSSSPTPGDKNIITQKTEEQNHPQIIYPRHIWINEFFPNPKGKDAENEFIEIYNPGPEEIDLTAWQIDDQENKGSHPYIFPENFIIKRGEYVTLPYSQTKISLNNNDDWVRLLWPDGQAIDEVPYSDPPEGESYNKTNNGWRWSCNTTPGEPNKIAADDECAASPEEETKNYSRALWINEFLPDPKGKDEEGEFIELQNRGEEEIDLTDWQIDDCENTGSKPHAFPENTKIKANYYLVLYYKETKISLNNNGDCVRLLNPAGQTIDEIKYGKAKEGQSYSRQNVDHWQWTDNPTPGKDNEFPQILAAKNSITKNNQPLATTPKRQTLPQTGPNMYFYYSPVFLFFFIFYLTKIKKYYKNRNCSFIKST